MKQINCYFKPFVYKLLCWLLCIIILLLPVFARATDDEDVQAHPVNAADVSAFLIAEATTLQVLDENQPDTLCYVAGLTKMPALLTIFKCVEDGKLSLEDSIGVSANAASITGPSAFIESGEKIKAEFLLKAAAMIGAGDAIVALGEHIYGTETVFLDAIHDNMKDIGIEVELQKPVGVGVKFSPRMLAAIGGELMKCQSFAAFSKLTYEIIYHSDGRETQLANANKMLKNYGGCSGVMTGSSPTDGYCGVFYATRGDMNLIAVVLNCKDSSTRFELASAALDGVFATKKSQRLADKEEVFAKDIKVVGGVEKKTDLIAKETTVLILDKNAPALKAREEIPKKINAPVTKEQVLGYVYFETDNGEELGKVELVAKEEIGQFSYRDIVKGIIGVYLRL